MLQYYITGNIYTSNIQIFFPLMCKKCANIIKNPVVMRGLAKSRGSHTSHSILLSCSCGIYYNAAVYTL